MSVQHNRGEAVPVSVAACIQYMQLPISTMVTMGAAHLAKQLLDGVTAQHVLEHSGGAEALVKLLTLPQPDPGMVHPLVHDTLAIPMPPLAIAAATSMTHLSAADKAASKKLLAAGALPAAVSLLLRRPPQPASTARQRQRQGQTPDEQRDADEAAPTDDMEAGTQILIQLLADLEAASAALVACPDAARGLSAAMAAEGSEAPPQASSAANIALRYAPLGPERDKLARALVRPMLHMLRGGGFSSKDRATAARGLAVNSRREEGALRPAICHDIAAAGGLAALTAAIRPEHGLEVAGPAAGTLAALFATVPAARVSPLVPRATVPALVQRLTLMRTWVPGWGANPGDNMYMVQAAADALDEAIAGRPAGFHAGNAEAAIAAGAVPAAAALCCSSDTLRFGGPLLAVLLGGGQLSSCDAPGTLLSAAAPAVQPLLAALREAPASAGVPPALRSELRRSATQALGSLAGAGMRARLRRDGVIPLLISMAGSNDREEAGSALTVLHLQVRESSQDQAAFVEAGGVRLLARLLLSRQRDPTLDDHVLNLLNGVAMDFQASRLAVVSQGGLLACIRWLRQTAASPSTHIATASYAMSCIGSLAEHVPGCKAAVLGLDGEAVLTAWCHRPGSRASARAARQAAQALLGLVKDKDTFQNFSAAWVDMLTAAGPVMPPLT